MASTLEKPLPAMTNIVRMYPSLPEHGVTERREEIKRILSGEDRRMLVVQGPCSFFPVEAGLEQTRLMAEVQREVADALLLIQRVYSQKPRTRGGWPGILTHPDPLDEDGDAEQGAILTRYAMSEAALHLPIADEMLNVPNIDKFDDLISYTAIGARTVESDPHRHAASGLDSAVGMKNSRDGNILTAVDAVHVAQQAKLLVRPGGQYRTTGNPYAHVILRGGTVDDKVVHNYQPAAVAQTSKLLREAGGPNPAIIIDGSHGHAVDPVTGKKSLQQQKNVLREVGRLVVNHPREFEFVRGVMMENFTVGGNQKISRDMRMDGLSITDPCLSLEDSIAAIQDLADQSRRRMRAL